MSRHGSWRGLVVSIVLQCLRSHLACSFMDTKGALGSLCLKRGLASWPGRCQPKLSPASSSGTLSKCVLISTPSAGQTQGRHTDCKQREGEKSQPRKQRSRSSTQEGAG